MPKQVRTLADSFPPAPPNVAVATEAATAQTPAADALVHALSVAVGVQTVQPRAGLRQQATPEQPAAQPRSEIAAETAEPQAAADDHVVDPAQTGRATAPEEDGVGDEVVVDQAMQLASRLADEAGAGAQVGDAAPPAAVPPVPCPTDPPSLRRRMSLARSVSRPVANG